MGEAFGLKQAGLTLSEVMYSDRPTLCPEKASLLNQGIKQEENKHASINSKESKGDFWCVVTAMQTSHPKKMQLSKPNPQLGHLHAHTLMEGYVT